MAGKNTAVFALFKKHVTGRARGGSVGRIWIPQRRCFGPRAGSAEHQEFATEKNTKAPEGTTTGVAAGGAIGGTLGLLAGIGALAIPGLGPFIAAGPIMGALAGLGAGAATGGLIGALVGMGMPEYEAKRYEGRIKDGGVLLSVHCDDSDWVSKAKDILKQAGGDDIASSGEKAVSSHTVTESVHHAGAGTLDRDVDYVDPTVRKY